jgi:hypothetical protein
MSASSLCTSQPVPIDSMRSSSRLKSSTCGRRGGARKGGLCTHPACAGPARLAAALAPRSHQGATSPPPHPTPRAAHLAPLDVHLNRLPLPRRRHARLLQHGCGWGGVGDGPRREGGDQRAGSARGICCRPHTTARTARLPAVAGSSFPRPTSTATTPRPPCISGPRRRRPTHPASAAATCASPSCRRTAPPPTNRPPGPY